MGGKHSVVKMYQDKRAFHYVPRISHKNSFNSNELIDKYFWLFSEICCCWNFVQFCFTAFLPLLSFFQFPAGSIEKETSAILLFVSFEDFKRVQEISVLVSLSKEYFFFHFLISVFRTAAS